MKKVFALMLLAGSLVACNNAGDVAETKKDSIDSTAEEVKDRLENSAAAPSAIIDSTKDIIDSSAEAKKDSVEAVH